MTTQANLNQYLGEDKTQSLAAVDSSGNALNISGWALTFKLHLYGNPTTVFVTKTVGSGITITNGPNGLYTVLLASVDTASLAADQYEYYVERTDPGSDTLIQRGGYTLLQK